MPASGTPPPPVSSPPPPPPPDQRLQNNVPDYKNQTLPVEHSAISIAFPPPGAPRNEHSPKSLPLPVVTDVSQKDQEAKQIPRSLTTFIRKREREPIRRTRKEEEKAYGRSFTGCGLQADYEITTKLGEGTFGWGIFFLFSYAAF